jgi:hypothetical protein
MIEFPRDGQISIADLKAFIEAKLGEGAATDQNLKNLFAKMEEHGFQLPNADIDAQGDSQAFIEPHKMSEVYGGKAPITEEGINYGNHELSLEVIRGSEDFEWLSNNRLDTPLTTCFSDPDAASFQEIELSSSNNYTIPFGSAGSFSDQQDIDSWTTLNASLSKIEGYYAGKITPSRFGGGIYLSFKANIGEEYYISAVSILKNGTFPDITANAKIQVGSSAWQGDYVEVIANSLELELFIPTSSTVYISITSEDYYSLNPFAAALVNCFRIQEYAGVQFGYCDVELHHNSESKIILPETEESSTGNYVSLDSTGNVILDQESSRQYYSFNCFFDVFMGQSQFEGYSTKQSFKSLTALYEAIISPWGRNPKRILKGTLSIPFIVDDGTSGVSNLSVNFLNSSLYGVMDYSNGTAEIYNRDVELVSSYQNQADAISAWKQNYLQEGQFYISNSGDRLFDWVTMVVHSSSLFDPGWLDAVLDQIYIFQNYTYNHARIINLSVGMKYPRYTSFPLYGAGNAGFQIKPFYYINLNENQKEQIEKAIQKCESMISQFYNFNLFFVPLVDSRSGGTLAAARPNTFNAIENGIFKNKKLERIFNLSFSSPVTSISYSSYLQRVVGTNLFRFNITSPGRNRCHVGFNIGQLKENYFYQIDVGYSYNNGDFNLFINVCVDGAESGGKRNVGRVAVVDDFNTHRAIFKCESSEVHYIELEAADASTLEGTASISYGSNVLYSSSDLTRSLSGTAVGGYSVLIKRQVYNVSSVSKQYNSEGDVIGSIVYLTSYYYYDDAENIIIYRITDVDVGDNFEISLLEVSEIKTFRTNDSNQVAIDAEPRDRLTSGTIFLDQIDLNSEASGRFLHDDKTLVYYIVLHEMLHTLGLGSYYFKKYNLISGSGYPTQYLGYYGNLMYSSLVVDKLNDLGKNLNNYYYGSIPMQGEILAHLAEYAKQFEGKIQPAFINELMTPYYNNSRGILSDITIGILEDLGYDVDYSVADSPILLELHEDTSVSISPGSSIYDQLIEKNNKKACYCCKHLKNNEIDN